MYIKVIKDEVYIDAMFYQYTVLEFYYEDKLIYEIRTEQDSDEDIQKIKTQLIRDLKLNILNNKY